MKFHKFATCTLISFLLGMLALQGCGYSAGSLNKTGITKLFIPVFRSTVYEPNLGVLTTGTVVKNFQRDGSVKITDEEDCDTILKATISDFKLSPARFRVENERTVREYYMSITVDFRVFHKGQDKPFNSGQVIGTTTFFTGDDLVNDKRQGVSYCAEEIGRQLVTKVVESW